MCRRSKKRAPGITDAKRSPDNLYIAAGEYLREHYWNPYSGQPTYGPKYSVKPNYYMPAVRDAMREFSASNRPGDIFQILEENTEISFSEKMTEYIKSKKLRSTEVYKAAQMDRRLFSKIISDRNYQPSKDTCIMLCLALRLSFEEADDMLSYAGYTFSHSNKRDVVLEFFFREQVYDLNDINEILDRLEFKILGRI